MKFKGNKSLNFEIPLNIKILPLLRSTPCIQENKTMRIVEEFSGQKTDTLQIEVDIEIVRSNFWSKITAQGSDSFGKV